MIVCICMTAGAQTDGGTQLDSVSNIARARALCRLNKPEEALYYYLSAQNSFDRQTDEGVVAVADIETEIGLLYFNRGHYERAVANFDKGLKVYNSYNMADKIRQNTGLIAASAYLNGDYAKSETFFQNLLSDYQKNKDRVSEKEIMGRLADIAQKREQYDKALKINSDLVEMNIDDGDMQGYFNAFNNTAYNLVQCGRYEEGADSFRDLIDEDIRNNAPDTTIAAAYTNLGLCYQNMGRSSECYECLEKAAELRKRCGQDTEYSKVCNIMALIYLKGQDLYNAYFYSKEAVASAERSNNPQSKSDAYQTYYNVLQARGEYDLALQYNQKFLALRDSALMQRLVAEQELADDLRRLEDAERQSFEEISEAEIMNLTIRQLQLLSDAQKRENDILARDLALKDMEKTRLQQQLALQRQQQNAIIREKEIADLQTQRQLDEALLRQKELEEKDFKSHIVLLEEQRQHQLSELEKEMAQKKQLVLSLVLFGILLVGLVVIYLIVTRKNHVLKSQKHEIEEKNNELTVQKEWLLMANDEIKHINDELTEQKKIIEVKNKSITDSIVYAQRIQKAVCPPADFLKDYNFDYFLIYRPRDIVSGDFYWFYKDGDNIFAVAADCTGHGVPGAFMSMLGVSLLTKIITERKIVECDKILNILRDEVKKTLHQDVNGYERKEGMDLSMIKINIQTLETEFAAANNNGYLLRSYSKDEKALAEHDMGAKDFVNETPDGYLRVKVILADKMPIGAFISDDVPFSSQKLQLCHGDIIYLTSDGLIDQFGGKHGRKFLSSNFAKLLANINSLPMAEQCDRIIKAHEEWRGDKYPQLDDIIVFGLKIL